MVTDKQRLDFLQDILKGQVICRNSVRGRGFRLHQTRSAKHVAISFTDIRKAIDDYMNKYPLESRCTCKVPEPIYSFYDACKKCKKPL